MDIIITAEVSDYDTSICSRECPFLEDGVCILFHKELENTVLPEGRMWMDYTPTKQRCSNCSGMDKQIKSIRG